MKDIAVTILVIIWILISLILLVILVLLLIGIITYEPVNSVEMLKELFEITPELIDIIENS